MTPGEIVGLVVLLPYLLALAVAAWRMATGTDTPGVGVEDPR